MAKFLLKKTSVGLVAAYYIQLFTLFGVGAFIYILPWYQTLDSAKSYFTILGLSQSTYAIIAFTIGTVYIAPYFVKDKEIQKVDIYLDRTNLYVWIGILSFFFLVLLASIIPGLSAIQTAFQNCFIVGICLGLWRAYLSQDFKSKLLYLGIMLVTPFIVLIFKGFLSIGFGMILIIITFISASFIKKRHLLIGLILGYMFLSIFVTYMRDRNDLRMVLWNESEGFVTRVDRVGKTFEGIEFFDPYDLRHLKAIDSRLNQNEIFGRVIEYISNGYQNYAYGSTLVDALAAGIPRLIWWNKSIAGGSGDLVSQYSGLVFSKETSVGITSVMEFYINFGTTGIIIGFLILGILLGYIDRKAKLALYNNRQTFIMWFLPGIAFLQVGGSFAEVSMSFMANIIIAFVLTQLLNSRRISLIT